MQANDVFLERFRAKRPAAFADAVRSLSLPVPWLLRHGTWPELADAAESTLHMSDYQTCGRAAEVLAVAPNAVTRIDVFLRKFGQNTEAAYHLRAFRLKLLPVDMDLVEHARAYRMVKPQFPIEVVQAACAHPDTRVQAHGVKALFDRLGKEAPLMLLDAALASGGLPRTVALRVAAARGDHDAITELIERAGVGQELHVRAEALRSLHLAGVPTSLFLPQALAGLHCLDSSEEAAPVASEAATRCGKRTTSTG